MKKTLRIFLLTIVLVFLSTYSPNKFDLITSEKDKFFSIKNIEITNNLIIEKEEINKKLFHLYNNNIFSINKNDIQIPLEEIDFLKNIEVKKKYPDTIIIKINETKPVGYIIKDNVKYLLDNSSNLILFKKNRNFKDLPNIFGKGAEINFINFFNKLINSNFPNKRIKNYYYFQIGRWDVQLKNDKVIKFPHNNVVYAIKKSTELLDRKDFKNYKIIDLRVDGKIIVE